MGGFPDDLPDGPYRGAIGATRTASIHYTCPCGTSSAVEVYRSVDASTHPELVARLLTEDPARALNTILCPGTSAPALIAVPVVYHDPGRRLLALVLPEAARHRELEERVALLQALAAEPADIPAYVRGFAVVFGPAGLRSLLERSPAPRAAEPAKTPAGATAKATAETTMIARVGEDAIEVLPGQLGEGGVLVADQLVDEAHAPLRPRQHGDDLTLMGSAADAAVEHWLTSREPILKLVGDRGRPRIAVRASEAVLDHLSSEGLEVRVQLHRFASGPLVVLVLGTAASLSGSAGAPAPFPVLFDLDAARDCAVLDALGHDFTFTLELFVAREGAAGGALVRRRTVSGDLAANVRYILAAAGEGRADQGQARSFTASARAFAAPDYDRYGWRHPERGELREDKLIDLSTAQRVRRALAVADRFTSPRREAYLFLLRGYPLHQWQARRRAVLARAVALGLWMGSRLAQVAVSEGLARSRRDLVQRLRQGFARLLANAAANDLDADAVSDNRAALDKEAAALGERVDRVDQPPGVPASPAPARASTSALLAALAHPERRAESAMALARLGESRFVAPVMAAVEQMGRSEAVRVLAGMAAFGEAATDALLRGLASNKGYVRQGSALALALIGSETAVEALSDALIAEPTPVWREVARGLGRVGPPAILPLASRLAHLLASAPAAAETSDHEHPRAKERVAWALAHIAAQGGAGQVAQLAGSRDRLGAEVARRALELCDSARDDDVPVHAEPGTDGPTMHRAFSRQFFESVHEVRPELASRPATIRAPSAPALVLDEADILEAAEEPGKLLDGGDVTPK